MASSTVVENSVNHSADVIHHARPRFVVVRNKTVLHNFCLCLLSGVCYCFISIGIVLKMSVMVRSKIYGYG